jgi:hypothetical protein
VQATANGFDLIPIPVSNSGSISGVTAMLAEHVFLYTLALLLHPLFETGIGIIYPDPVNPNPVNGPSAY